MKKYLISFFVAVFPLIAYAQPAAAVSDFKSLVDRIISFVLNPALWLLMALGVVLFLWGVVKYIQSGENAEQRTESAKFMTWGIIALFVMVSVYGLIKVVKGTFRLDSDTQPIVPALRLQGTPGTPPATP